MNILDKLPPMEVTDRVPNPVDIHVGAKVRQLRKFKGLSQAELGAALGLTFQQVQKYERGANRISASKLYETARFLGVPVAYFFEGYGQDEEDAASPSGQEVAVQRFLHTSEGIELAAAFPRILKPRHRRKILNLVTTLAEVE